MTKRKPKRIQLRRTFGWRKPEGAIVCARPAKYGNPYKVLPSVGRDGESGWWHVETWDGANHGTPRSISFPTKAQAAKCAVIWYRADIGTRAMHRWSQAEIRADLAGHDLACWCPPAPYPCHVDVLLEIANKKP